MLIEIRNIFECNIILNITETASYDLFDALLAAIFLVTYVFGVFILYIEYKYLKGRVENGLL